jgi:hypothetical protein
MSLFEIARQMPFAARCAASGALAHLLARGVSLPHPVSNSTSNLIVSQESCDATRHSIVGRFIGTIAGAAVAILVSEVATRVGVGTAFQIAAAVGTAGLLARAMTEAWVAEKDAEQVHAAQLGLSVELTAALPRGLVDPADSPPNDDKRVPASASAGTSASARASVRDVAAKAIQEAAR